MRVLKQLDQSAIDHRANPILAAAYHMSPDGWAAERVLAQTKWFDYRFLSPAEATLLFVEEYQRTFRQWWRVFDSAEVDKKRGIAANGLFHSRKGFSEFWTARAHADLMGVPYRIYISTAMEVALRRAKQTRLLRAGQLRREDCVRAIEKRWEEELAGGGCWLSELPHYRAENDCALPDQIAHQEHVAQTARKRSNFRLALGMAIDGLRVLPVEKAETAFDAELIVSAREGAAGIGTPASFDVLADDQLMPSCFGLPAPLDVGAEPCCRCPLAAQCQLSSGRILADVISRYGSQDPALQHCRELGRERVRRFRERNRPTVDAEIQKEVVAEEAM
ncbi:hypothetical protein C0214_05840 [Methylobacterium sp. DM1]|nr:hypothetical protein C0214_05840 [Methylobacterium sp. DM1]